MLSNQTCTNVEYVFSEKDQFGSFKFLHNNVHDAPLSDLGYINGCAIYYKDTDGLTERVVASGYSGSHYEIERFLIEEKKIDFYKFTAGVVQYGYITDKGYFLNRTIAMLAYRNMCKKTESNQPGEDQLYLHDWNFSWSVFDKLKD